MSGRGTWALSQCFGTSEGEPQERDTITAIEFSRCGEHIAVGDRGGRVWIFSTARGRSRCKPGTHASRTPEPVVYDEKSSVHYEFYGQFQSHEPEFDYLKSLEIEERINSIKWLHRTNNSLTLLAANDKTIKLWKIFEKPVLKPAFSSLDSDPSHGLRIPNMVPTDTITAAVPRRIYANHHAYHITSLAVNSDCETFLSADDLRINLWHIDMSDVPFLLLDRKPDNMDELTEVITGAILHPTHCNVMAYGTSKGKVYLCDLRSNALIEGHSKEFGEEIDDTDKSFFSEILTSISDQCFSGDGRFLLTRDYMTVKVWDVRQEKEPLSVLPIHPHLQDKMCELYENDAVFDRFECVCSPTRPVVMSGTYDDKVAMLDWVSQDVEFCAISRTGGSSPPGDLTPATAGTPDEDTMMVGSTNLTRKVLHLDWHPQRDVVAVANGSYMYIFNQAPGAEGPAVIMDPADNSSASRTPSPLDAQGSPPPRPVPVPHPHQHQHPHPNVGLPLAPLPHDEYSYSGGPGIDLEPPTAVAPSSTTPTPPPQAQENVLFGNRRASPQPQPQQPSPPDSNGPLF